jgi:hypothetical protein
MKKILLAGLVGAALKAITPDPNSEIRHQLSLWDVLTLLCGQLFMAKGNTLMKKLALPVAAVLALLSIAGCAQYIGKGKAPPPVVTKG